MTAYFDEGGIKQERSPHENFSTDLYKTLKNELAVLIPNSVVNTGLISKGDRSITRISLSSPDGTVPAGDWMRIKARALEIYGEQMRDSQYDGVFAEGDINIGFNDTDPDYDEKQTVVITKI